MPIRAPPSIPSCDPGAPIGHGAFCRATCTATTSMLLRHRTVSLLFPLHTYRHAKLVHATAGCICQRTTSVHQLDILSCCSANSECCCDKPRYNNCATRNLTLCSSLWIAVHSSQCKFSVAASNGTSAYSVRCWGTWGTFERARLLCLAVLTINPRYTAIILIQTRLTSGIVYHQINLREYRQSPSLLLIFLTAHASFKSTPFSVPSICITFLSQLI